jgi:hypothetical protein
LVVARAAVNDTILTRNNMRGLAIATYTASLRDDGTIERTTLTPLQQAQLREQAEALETATASLRARQPGKRGDCAAETVTIAKEQRLPLWCDDTALRQKARASGIPTFGLLDLVTVLSRRGTKFDQPATLRRLAEQYVVDLPLAAADLVALAAIDDWQQGPAHIALARSEWRRHHNRDWADTWLQIATHARRFSADALVDTTKAALTGSVEHISSGRRTQRYQQLVVLALLACHDAGTHRPPICSIN